MTPADQMMPGMQTIPSGFAPTAVAEQSISERRAVDDWNRRIASAKADKKQWLELAELVLPLYRGAHQSERIKDIEEAWPTHVTVPLLKGVHQAKMPWLHARIPRYRARARRTDLEPFAQTCIALLDYIWHEQKVSRQTELSVNEGQQINISSVMIGWDERRRVPACKHFPAEDIFIDPDARNDLSEARWIAIREIVPLEAVKTNPRYRFHPETAMDSQEVLTNINSDADHRIKQSQRDAGVKITSLYHIYTKDGVPPLDMDTRESDLAPDETPYRLITIAKDYPFKLRDVAWPVIMDYDEFPLELLKFIDGVSAGKEKVSLWGSPSGEAVKRLLYGVDWIITFMLAHGKRAAVTKLLHDEGLDPKIVDQLLSNKDMEAVAVPPQSRVELLKTDTSFPGLDRLLNIALDLFDQIEGFDQIVRGGQGQTQTATEADIRGRHAQSRLTHDADVVESWVSNFARKLLQVARLHMTVDDIGFFLGPRHAQVWLQHQMMYRNDFSAMVRSIVSEIEISVEPGSIRFGDEEAEKQKTNELAQITIPIYEKQGWFLQLREILRQWMLAHKLDSIDGMLPTDDDLQRSYMGYMAQFMPAIAPAIAPTIAPTEEGGGADVQK